ncbi:hypothetical protein [Chelativorans xinjiangense]|uniref:hypothetical protein n=1 Tax=Chelativorans xinjiangense TaxID=2681485 RepID=UPI0013592714|nr:hypothetical protein [Chelativorans xinjiangense]
MTRWLKFMGAAVGWSLICRAILELAPVHPIAVFFVWVVGFLWLTGWIAAGPKDADDLVKYCLATLALIALGGSVLFLLIAPFT